MDGVTTIRYGKPDCLAPVESEAYNLEVRPDGDKYTIRFRDTGEDIVLICYRDHDRCEYQFPVNDLFRMIHTVTERPSSFPKLYVAVKR